MRDLYFITETYNGNKVFFSTELEELSKRYRVIFVGTSGDEVVENPISNVEYHYYTNEVSKLSKIKYMFRYIFDKKCIEEKKVIKNSSKSFIHRLLLLFRSIEYYAYAEEFYKWFMKNVYGEDSHAIYYSYWCNYYALSMLLHKDNFSDMKFVSRLHRFDLYDDQFPGGRQPFKQFINRNIDKLFFVSQNSLNYYRDIHQEVDSQKLVLNRLGTLDLPVSNELRHNKKFLLVSCSHMVPVKRVDYIVRALAVMKEPIHWIHFGGGKCMEDIRDKAEELLQQKSNISYELRGATENQEIRKFYAENYVDAFINVSESEGAPVSIMEAMSANIPVIATNVGEADIMLDGNGILLDANPSINDIAEAISGIINMSEEEVGILRTKSYSRWKDIFSVERNVTRFIEEIESI